MSFRSIFASVVVVAIRYVLAENSVKYEYGTFFFNRLCSERMIEVLSMHGEYQSKIYQVLSLFLDAKDGTPAPLVIDVFAGPGFHHVSLVLIFQ